jgi:hypothetical protein
MDEWSQNGTGEKERAYRPGFHSREVHRSTDRFGNRSSREIEDVLGEGETHANKKTVDEAVHRPVDIFVEGEEEDEQTEAFRPFLNDGSANRLGHNVVLGGALAHRKGMARPPPVAVEG